VSHGLPPVRDAQAELNRPCISGRYVMGKGCQGDERAIEKSASHQPTYDELEAALRTAEDAHQLEDVIQLHVALAHQSEHWSARQMFHYRSAQQTLIGAKSRPSPSARTIDAVAESAYMLVSWRFGAFAKMPADATCLAPSFEALFGNFTTMDNGPAKMGAWDQLVYEMSAYFAALDDDVVRAFPSSRWAAKALLDAGTRFYATSARLRACNETGIEMFTKSEREMLEPLDRIDPTKAARLRSAKTDLFLATREQGLRSTDQLALNLTARGIALSNALGVEADGVAAGRKVLHALRNVVGRDTVVEYLSRVLDPTDPNRTRHLDDLADYLAPAN